MQPQEPCDLVAIGPVGRQIEAADAIGAPLEIAPRADLGVHQPRARAAAEPEQPLHAGLVEIPQRLRKIRAFARGSPDVRALRPAGVVPQQLEPDVAHGVDAVHVEPSQSPGKVLLEVARVGPPGNRVRHQGVPVVVRVVPQVLVLPVVEPHAISSRSRKKTPSVTKGNVDLLAGSKRPPGQFGKRRADNQRPLLSVLHRQSPTTEVLQGNKRTVAGLRPCAARPSRE